MSLLDVFVILAYYDQADANKANLKITNQQFNNEYVISKIRKIKQYHSSALHWNLEEVNKENLCNIIDNVKASYSKIQKQTGIQLHNFEWLDNLKCHIEKDVSDFIDFSRKKAKQAQSREILTKQPKENLCTYTKVKITIENFLGGKYHFTVDETKIDKNTLYLIEDKNSEKEMLPSEMDIKDGLLKMILYTNINICTVNMDDFPMKIEAVLNLTSPKLIGNINSKICSAKTEEFIRINNLEYKQDLIKKLFEEANRNNFTVKIGCAKK